MLTISHRMRNFPSNANPDGGERWRSRERFPGAARLHLVDGVALLRPEEQVFEAMLDGLAQPAAGPEPGPPTVEGRRTRVRAFAAHVNAFPWQWTPAMVDEWLGDLRSVRGLRRSTIRVLPGGGPRCSAT